MQLLLLLLAVPPLLPHIHKHKLSAQTHSAMHIIAGRSGSVDDVFSCELLKLNECILHTHTHVSTSIHIIHVIMVIGAAATATASTFTMQFYSRQQTAIILRMVKPRARVSTTELASQKLYELWVLLIVANLRIDTNTDNDDDDDNTLQV